MEENNQNTVFSPPGQEDSALINSCSGDDVHVIVSLEETSNNIRKDINDVISKWAQAFGESERYDDYYEDRLDELIKQAHKHEDSMRQQKELLTGRLKRLTKAFALVDNL